ncbi:MAG: flippase-like domain-containing protein [Caldilineaceae bacterium]|nr:flippase-like domain-containing protein [Caldilineaceae bacterium]
MSKDLRKKLIYSLLAALLVYVALALWSDWQALVQALLDFPWAWLPVVVALTLVNYAGRLLKWQWYLRVVGVDIPRRDSARIFGVGMLMVMTPGKAGEFLKSYMVKNVTGTPMSVTAPIIFAERLTDGMAMLLLASAGLFAFPDTRARFIAGLVVAFFFTFVAVVQIRPLALRFLAIGESLPVINRFAHSFHTLYESSYLIFRPRNLLISLAIGAVNWGAEGVAYFVVLVGFGAPATLETMMIAVFIFCISTVIGAVFALPGGLGGVEGSMVALSMRILGMTSATATAAALLTRFCTLWLGVGIGVVSFFLWPDLMAGAENARSQPAPTLVDGSAPSDVANLGG